MNREQGASGIRWMSRGAGKSGQVSEGVSGGSAQMWRGGRKGEQMQRSVQEQRVNRNRGVSGCGQASRGLGRSGWVSRQVSRHGRWMWRGKRKNNQAWRSKQKWSGQWKWRNGWKWLGDWRCKQEQLGKQVDKWT